MSHFLQNIFLFMIAAFNQSQSIDSTLIFTILRQYIVLYNTQ